MNRDKRMCGMYFLQKFNITAIIATTVTISTDITQKM